MNPALPYFDDFSSSVHAWMGATAAAYPAVAALIALGYVMWQAYEREPLANKFGDFLEFGTGYLGYVAISGARK